MNIPKLIIGCARKDKIEWESPTINGTPTAPPKRFICTILTFMDPKKIDGAIRDFDNWKTVTLYQEDRKISLNCSWSDLDEKKPLIAISTDNSIPIKALLLAATHIAETTEPPVSIVHGSNTEPSESNAKMGSATKTAIIGGIFAILAAIISGVFLLVNTFVSTKTTQENQGKQEITVPDNKVIEKKVISGDEIIMSTTGKGSHSIVVKDGSTLKIRNVNKKDNDSSDSEE